MPAFALTNTARHLARVPTDFCPTASRISWLCRRQQPGLPVLRSAVGFAVSFVAAQWKGVWADQFQFGVELFPSNWKRGGRERFEPLILAPKSQLSVSSSARFDMMRLCVSSPVCAAVLAKSYLIRADGGNHSCEITRNPCVVFSEVSENAGVHVLLCAFTTG